MIEIQVSVNLAPLDQWMARVEAELEAECVKLAFMAEAEAKLHAPVDTGALRASIFTVTSQGSGFSGAMASASSKRSGSVNITPPKLEGRWEAWVCGGVYYAPFVEYGNAHWAGHPFMAPAAAMIRPKAAKAVADAISRVTRGSF